MLIPSCSSSIAMSPRVCLSVCLAVWLSYRCPELSVRLVCLSQWTDVRHCQRRCCRCYEKFNYCFGCVYSCLTPLLSTELLEFCHLQFYWFPNLSLIILKCSRIFESRLQLLLISSDCFKIIIKVLKHQPHSCNLIPASW